jgi:hypothetical protein
VSESRPNFSKETVALSRVIAIKGRYSDAYLVSQAVDGSGRVIKGIGVIAAAVFLLVGLWWIGNGRVGDGSFPMGVVCIISGLFVGTLFYLIGVLISAQGQILKASLDNAVNSSPFLTDDHRAEIMSLL